MSELKVYVQPIKKSMMGNTIVGMAYYLKSEADKVIAGLKESRMGWIHRCGVAEEGERHQKYKRCLAMADGCEYLCAHYQFREVYKKRDFFRKWMFRWMELAEQFKEAK